MKKMYLSLLLTTTIISVSCMEKERPRKRTSSESQSLSINPSTILPVHILSMQPNLPTCEANQPGWQQLNRIANMTYHGNPSQITQSSTTNEFELKPIYKHANTNITQKEQKPLLQTNSLQPDETVMQDLYKRAASIVNAEYDGSKYTQWAINDALVKLITHMNNAKNNNICEDVMGEFAYKQTKEWNTYCHYIILGNCDSYKVNIAPVVPITFILLKKYNATIYQTSEQIPLHFDTSTHTDQTPAFVNDTNVGDDITQYPAFFQFHYTLRRAIKEIKFDKIKTFIKYLYENNDISQEGHSDGSYKDLNSEFYTNAYNYLFNEKSLDSLYSLLQIISKAKELREIDNENDLIVCINPENKPIKGQIFGWFSSTHSDDNVKNRITLLCKLIKEYNTARDYKLTPTIAQYYVYYVQRFINVPLPEPIYNSAHLDDTFYAFEEFEQLRIANDKLIKLTIDQVNEQINDLKKFSKENSQ